MAEMEETRTLVGVGRSGRHKKQGRLRRLTRVAEAMKAWAWALCGYKDQGWLERDVEARKAEVSEAWARAKKGTTREEEGAGREIYCHPVTGYPMPFSPTPFFPEPPRRACDHWLPFLRREPEYIRAAKALDALDKELFSRKIPRAQLRAMDHKTLAQCLEWYNSKHPDDQYEPAPGMVTRSKLHNKKSTLWIHGNFVARRKSSGCFSFLHAPRTLFFFEIVRHARGGEEVVTCTPIDEPVTEAYTFLGFPLGRGIRRHGGADCVCKTCYRQFHAPHIGCKRTCGCGDSKVESVCKMCYLNSCVLHPVRGGFTFG